MEERVLRGRNKVGRSRWAGGQIKGKNVWGEVPRRGKKKKKNNRNIWKGKRPCRICRWRTYSYSWEEGAVAGANQRRDLIRQKKKSGGRRDKDGSGKRVYRVDGPKQ